MNEVTALLDAGGMAMLQQGVQGGFQSLPAPYRSLALQTARLVGLMTEETPAGSVMTFAALGSRLEAVASASSQLVDSTRLDIESALQQGPQQRAAMLAPHVTQLREAGLLTSAAIARMPVAELCATKANRELVKEKLSDWAQATETLHQQLKAQFGELHPTTAVALHARTEASAAYCKTMLRMAAAQLGSMAFNMTVGPVVSGVARLFGSGN